MIAIDLKAIWKLKNRMFEQNAGILNVTANDAFKVDAAEFSKLQNDKKYSQNTTIYIGYDRVDHIAVCSYMFPPLSAIVRLYYLLL